MCISALCLPSIIAGPALRSFQDVWWSFGQIARPRTGSLAVPPLDKAGDGEELNYNETGANKVSTVCRQGYLLLVT